MKKQICNRMSEKLYSLNELVPLASSIKEIGVLNNVITLGDFASAFFYVEVNMYYVEYLLVNPKVYNFIRKYNKTAFDECGSYKIITGEGIFGNLWGAVVCVSKKIDENTMCLYSRVDSEYPLVFKVKFLF